MPRKKKRAGTNDEALEKSAAPVRPIWSGTITFGLVSIPVNLYSAVRPRQTAMKLVDKSGNALGREYHCSRDGKELDQDELVRGYETEQGEMVVITDEEFESVAPEMSGDIELRSFVPLEQIPALYFQRSYFLAPAGRSAKAYHLLTETMQRTDRIGIGSFVMRGHEYLVAIIADNGVLRADALRYANELRTPRSIGLPRRRKVNARTVTALSRQIDKLTARTLDIGELEDRDAQALQDLAHEKQREGEDVIHPKAPEEAEAQEGGQVIDLMEVLRKSLSKKAVVSHAGSGPPISLDEHRARKAARSSRNPAKKRAARKKATRRKRAS